MALVYDNCEDVRSEVEDRVGSLSGWTAVDVPADQFDAKNVANAVAATALHLAFAIGIGDYEPLLDRDRQDVTVGLNVTTLLQVVFLTRIKAKDQRTAVDAGLEAERTLIGRLLAKGWASFQVRFLRASRETPSSGEFRKHTVTFGVVHRLQLTS